MTGFRLIGVLHLPPLPGAVNYTGQSVAEIAEIAAQDAVELQRAGFTDVMVQDANDKPQRTRVDAPTVAAMSSIGFAVASRTDIALGVVAGHNDGPSAVAIAHAIGARFVRVKVLTGISVGPQGFIEGCAVETHEMKKRLGSDIEIWADVHEATSRPVTGSRVWAATEALKFGAANRLVVTSDGGVQETVDWIAELRSSVPISVPYIIGGRVTAASMPLALGGSDGAIIGNAVKSGNGYNARVDASLASELANLAFPVRT